MTTIKIAVDNHRHNSPALNGLVVALRFNMDKKAKIEALKVELRATTDLKIYRSILGKIAGMSGSRASKRRAGAIGGRANRGKPRKRSGAVVGHPIAYSHLR